MRELIVIDWDERHQKLVLKCPFWANDLVRSLPACRWSKAQRAWLVPPTRMNVEQLQEKLVKPKFAEATREAARIMADTGQEQAKKSAGFPAWYKFKSYQPRKHQWRGLNKLYGLHANAWHAGMGTGKTFMEIAVSCALRMEGKIDAHLVIPKLSLRKHWMKQYALHGAIDADTFGPDTSKLRLFEKWLGKPHDFPVMIAGIESMSAGRMHELVRQFLLAYPNARMTIDESHMIASHKAICSKRCVELGQLARYRATMTGTPTRIGPLDLFMPFEFLDTNIVGIGDYFAFRNRYAVMGGYRVNNRPVQVVGYQNMDELTRLIAPYVFEVTKDEALPDLPPKSYKRIHVQLTKEQRDLYRKVKKEGEYGWAGKEMVVSNVLELALRLHQIAGGFITTYTDRQIGPDKVKRESSAHAIIPWKQNPKIVELVALGKENPGSQFVVWCAYRAEIDAVTAAIGENFTEDDIRPFYGGLGEIVLEESKMAFQNKSARWLVANAATGGAGHEFTAADIMVYFNNTQKMIDRAQSEDRAHRDGLDHPVLYVDLIAEGTVDETIMESNEQKMDLADYIRRHIRNADALLGSP